MALSTTSFGIFSARAFSIKARRRELVSGLAPPSFTAISISFPIRVNVLAILSQRANFLALRYSNALPINALFFLQSYKKEGINGVWNHLFINGSRPHLF